MSEAIKRSTTIKEAKQLVDFCVQACMADTTRSSKMAPLFLWGPPGVGKSSIIRQVCQTHGIGICDLRLSQLDSVDLRGLPRIEEGRTVWSPNGELPTSGMGILLLDELNHASKAVQTAAFQLVLDRSLGLYNVPDGWFIVAAGNRAEDRSTSVPLASALANRFLHLNVESDIESFRNWGVGSGLHPDVLGFLDYRPALLLNMEGDLQRGFPTPRSWERVSQICFMAEERSLSSELFTLAIQGLVGTGPSVEFEAFRKVSQEQASVDAILRNPEKHPLPDSAQTRYALVSGLVYHVRRELVSGRNAILDPYFEVSLRLPSDFAASAMVQLLTCWEKGEELNALRLTQHKRFIDWQKKHGTAFRQRAGGSIHVAA